MENKSGHFGIVVSGGPAPGINCVISSATIEANNRGYKVFGLNRGFKALTTGAPDALRELRTESVATILGDGGSIIGTSRFNPFVSSSQTENFITGLRENKIDKLIIIGGEGSAWLSLQLSKLCPYLSIVHVPKTIDNDLILPNHHPSFGYETACAVGTQIVRTLHTDATTTRRWFIVTAMGRKAGFLALGIGLASSATLTVIPEEFAGAKATPDQVAEIVYESIRKRRASGKPYGVAILAEGIMDCLDPESSPELKTAPRDNMGRIIYSQLELGEVVMPALKRRCREIDMDTRLYSKNIGYELRCHDPLAFDIEYTRFLGYGAVKYLAELQAGQARAVMVVRDYDKLGYVPVTEMAGSDGNIKSRHVDLSSDLYKVARSFMIR